MRPDDAEPPLLRVSGLAVAAGGRTLFADIDFVAAPGACVLVTGRNGSGKSSLLRVIAGLRRAEAGAIELASAPHYLGHALGLKTRLTGRAHFDLWRREPVQELEPAHDPLGLRQFEHLPVGVLSRGQAQRIALARLHLDRRAIWLLDEPTGPLDRDGIAIVEGLVDRHCAAGGAAVIATHRPLKLSAATATLDLSA